MLQHYTQEKWKMDQNNRGIFQVISTFCPIQKD
jgi:hypothetical protein